MPYLEYCDTHGEYEGEECPRCEAANEAALEADRRLDTDKMGRYESIYPSKSFLEMATYKPNMWVWLKLRLFGSRLQGFEDGDEAYRYKGTIYITELRRETDDAS